MPFSDAAPFYPNDEATLKSGLLDKASDLRQRCAYLDGQLAPSTRERLIDLMKEINSYYSNLIEGNSTEPYEIRLAQKGQLSDDPKKRDMQIESLSHIDTQQWLAEQNPNIETVFSPGFIKSIHKRFYEKLPASLLNIEHDGVKDRVIPGQFRSRPVIIGRYIPPEHTELESMMNSFHREYSNKYRTGDKLIVSIMASHHRFVWIHPFLDGNGRVVRLLTDAALKAAGLGAVGVWCLSRGLARTPKDYKARLERADYPFQGTADGRGPLSLNNLLEFCHYMLDQAMDQVDYISDLLQCSGMSQRIAGYIQARSDHRVPGVSSPLKPDAALILYHAFLAGEISRAHALQMCPGGERNARRLLRQLKEEGLLSETSSRSPLRWETPEHALPWYFPALEPQRS